MKFTLLIILVALTISSTVEGNSLGQQNEKRFLGWIGSNIIKPIVKPINDIIVKPINDVILKPVVDVVIDNVVKPINDHVLKPVIDAHIDHIIKPIAGVIIPVIGKPFLIVSKRRFKLLDQNNLEFFVAR